MAYKKKIIILVLGIALFCSFIIFHHSLMCLGIKSYLNARLPKGGKFTFDYKTAYMEDGAFIFQKVSLSRQEKHNNLGFDIQVDGLRFSFDLNFFPFRFKPRIIFDHPQISLAPRDLKIVKNERSLYKILDQHFFRTPIKIHHGEIHFGKEVVFLNFETPNKNNPGLLQIYKNLESSPAFSTVFLKEKKKLLFDMKFEQLDVPWVFEISRYFSSKIPSLLTVSEGKINGKLSLSLINPKKVDFIKYALDLSEFALRHEKQGLYLGVNHLGWKKHFITNDKIQEIEVTTFFEKIWPYFIGDGEFTGLNFRIKDSHTNNHWIANDVQGSVRFSQKNEPIIHLLGNYIHNEKEQPFQLTGEGYIKNNNFWKIACDLNLINDINTQLYFAMTSQDNCRYLMQTEFSHINTDLFHLFQYLASSQIQNIDTFKLYSGDFSGKMQGWMANKKMTHLEVINFCSKEINVTVPEKNLICKVNEIKGKGEFDFLTNSFCDGTFWEVDVKKGEINSGKGLEVEQLDLHIAMHDQYIKPSNIKYLMNGIKGTANFEGLYTHLNLNLGLDLSLNKLLNLFELKNNQVLQDTVALNLEMHLKTVNQKMEVDGNLGVIHEKGSKDSIEFGWNWDLLKLWKEGFRQTLDLGWFKASCLSDKTINLPLICCDKNWRGEGNINIEGIFNSHAVEFSLDPTNLTYHSPEIDIKSQITGEEKAPNCTFNFDLEKQVWRGKIPLKGVYLKEHFFGIEFDSFTSEVDLETNEFLFQNVDAITKGVHFQAEMALNFACKDQNELIINTYQIDGDARDILPFLKHFNLFEIDNFPLEGKITSGPGEMHLHAYIGDVKELLKWRIALHFNQGRYVFSDTLAFDNLSGDMYFSAEDQLFQINNTQGQLLLSAGLEPKSYELNLPIFQLDSANRHWQYDARLETSTHDICRIAGQAIKEEKNLEFLLDYDRTRLFGAKIDISKLSFTEEGSLNQVSLKTTISALDLFHHIDFLSSAGVMPLNPMTIHEMRTTKFEGDVDISLDIDKEEEVLAFCAQSKRLLFGALDLDHIGIQLERRGDRIILDRFQVGMLSMQASMDKLHKEWSIPQFEIIWNQCHLKGGGGNYNEESKKLFLPLKDFKVNLEELFALFPSSPMNWSYLTGTLFTTGALTFDFSSGFRNLSFDSEIKVIGEDFGKGQFHLESPERLHLSFDIEKGFKLREAHFNFFHPQSNQLWAKCHFDELIYIKEEWKGKNFFLSVSPEMVHFLGKTHSIPKLRYKDERLILFDHSLRWDNQIEATMDFSIGKNSILKGSIKEGYYWVGDRAWYLSDLAFKFENEKLDFKLKTLFDEVPFDLLVNFSFLPHFTSKVIIEETICNKKKNRHPFILKTRWNEQEGFYIQSMNGQVCGLNFDFHHNPKESFRDKAVLTGQLKVDFPALSKFFPEKYKEKIQEFEIGSGYELSGDLILSKLRFADSHFIGFCKGKHFQLMGSVMETLMSEVAIYSHNIEFTNFNISDSSGIFQTDTIRLEQIQGQKWSVEIPEMIIQDFRPSLLKKIGKYPGRIKPLTIREIKFRNIKGYIGEAKSFAGQGELNFINTFKRDYNILDIPFEILGRLGLDVGLLVPIRGVLNFIMIDGRVYLKELLNSHSEGKRSKFYLSPSQPSYIDFDGNLNINIKMKQYVLLKFTEPFTLSIGGNLEHPKYGLR